MRLLLLALLAGCAPAEEPPADDWPEGLARLAPVSNECPDLSESGTKVFMSDGVEREVHVYLPENPQQNLGVVFFWHPLGITAADLARYLRPWLFAEEWDYVWVMPEAHPDTPFRWGFWADDGYHDGVLYDDLRTCLSQQWNVDLERVSTTGISAGGLMSTWLTVHRSDTLATSLVMSGGTGQVVYYQEPVADIPVLVMWGGEPDVYTIDRGPVDFNASSLEFSSNLQGDGHFVVECDHGTGHTIPLDGIGVLETWLLPHRWGRPSPFLGGQDMDLLPNYCRIPQAGVAD